MPVQRRTSIYGALLMASQVAMVGWLAPLASGAAGIKSAGMQFRVIMTSGQQAPGTSEGVELFNPSINHDNSPRINNQGVVLFPARLAGEGIDTSNDGTYYLHDGHSLALVAREGDQAPGQNPGVFYGGFINRDLNLSDQGQVVFTAQLAGAGVNEVNDRALYYASGGSVVPIARIGTSIPNSSLGRYYLTRSFTDVQFDAMGRVYYGAGLGIGPVVQEYGPAQAIYRFDGGETSLSVTRATSSPVALESFPEFAISADGKLSLLAVLDLPFGNGRRDTQILELKGSSLTSIVREEQLPPGYPRFTEFGQPSIGTPFADITRNNAGVTAFTSWLFGNFGWNGLRHSIWMHDPDQAQPLREVVSVTSSLPNHPNFVVSQIHSDSGIQSLQLNEAGHLAFFASLYDSVEGGDSQWALLVDRGDGLDWVYKQGDQVPHLPAGTRFASGSFFRETGFQMNESGQIAFAANYWNPNGESGRGLFLAQPDGQIIPILQTGDLLELAPGDFREVDWFSHFSDISPASGFARSLNDRGELALLVRFTDNSTAILVAGVPEPASLALLGTVALAAGLFSRRDWHKE